MSLSNAKQIKPDRVVADHIIKRDHTNQRVYVSMGSNVRAEENIPSAIRSLKNKFVNVLLSPSYESKSLGFDGDNFINLVVAFDTMQDLDALTQSLRDIEAAHGRSREDARFGPRTLDLDLLLYGKLIRHDHEVDLPRKEIAEYAFVLKPLSDLIPEQKHLETELTYREMWQDYNGDKNQLWLAENLHND